MVMSSAAASASTFFCFLDFFCLLFVSPSAGCTPASLVSSRFRFFPSDASVATASATSSAVPLPFLSFLFLFPSFASTPFAASDSVVPSTSFPFLLFFAFFASLSFVAPAPSACISPSSCFDFLSFFFFFNSEDASANSCADEVDASAAVGASSSDAFFFSFFPFLELCLASAVSSPEGPACSADLRTSDSPLPPLPSASYPFHHPSSRRCRSRCHQPSEQVTKRELEW
ncbi:uncharacterized protein B0H18DRAFT_422336 [Fomitopsis serialis]|uniref:uncharacterized protein n=1 Tax=Fomitopsis serialis TaxID=139415 RepID=UPI002008BB18|nr:uncharacterized protein B0H18DRAFT_422336 [Neoantrodia serialis]KAH9935761.1 hypothetical protein B0H18DRAFT_422336 [Neoantrodia serialis]